jgi:hypothetical protein
MHDYLLRRFLEQCLWTAAWAGGASLAVQLLGAIGETKPARAAAAAIAVGLFTALYHVQGVPSLPPDSRWQWIPWIAAAALLLLFVEEGKSAPGVRAPLLLALTGAIDWFVLRPNGRLSGLSEPVRLTILIGLGTVFLAVLWSGETRAALVPMWRTFGLQAVTAAATAVCYATRSQDFGRITAGFAAALGAAALFGLAKAAETAGRTAATVASVFFCGLLLVNGLSVDFPVASALLLLASWLAPLLPNRGTGRDHAIQISCAVAPAAIAVVIALV